MKRKQFKTESQKLLDMMINSIYTHKEIFLRELISNASDAIDKLYFRSLTDDNIKIGREDYAIHIKRDTDARTLTISDNGCGMSAEELENNLGTIAKSGSYDFKRENNQNDAIDIIGQFGVGFYSAFMVADKITVRTKQYGESTAYLWESEGVQGYRIGECDKESFGTEIILHIKEDKDGENYSEFLDEYRIRALIKKYSDYVRYPIKMNVTKSVPIGDGDEYEEKCECETLNSMVPIWKKSKGEVSNEDYNNFYKERYYDFKDPFRTVTQKSEGTVSYNALLYIPSHTPFNYYTKEYEKGLELYSSGVMIMEKCKDLLPDYFGFVRGLIDSADLSLNVSRELLQHDRQLKIIAKAIEKKIKSELETAMEKDREGYEKFFDEFGLQLKYGVYSDYGMHKDTLKDLLLFKSSDKKYISLKEYLDAMADGQNAIYYASGESVDKIEMLPQVEAIKERGFSVLYLTDDVDEFALKVLGSYGEKEFKNVTSEKTDLTTDEEKSEIEKKNQDYDNMLKVMAEHIGCVASVRFTKTLKEYAARLSTEGELSVEMEKILKKMPGADSAAPKASIVLELNLNHPIAEKLISLYGNDTEAFKDYSKTLYYQACLSGGVSISNPKEFNALISKLMI